MLLLVATTALAQERPATGASCVPVAYSDYLVVLNDRVLAAGDAYASSIGEGYTVAESKRKGLVAVVTNTHAQVTSLGDCQGDTALRDSVAGLIDFWDEMARDDLVTITGFLLDGNLTDDEATAATRLLTDLGTRGTATEIEVIEAQRRFASRFGFTVKSDETEPETPAYAPPPEEPAAEPYVYTAPVEPEEEYRYTPSRDPKVFVRIHGGLGLDYLLDSGRRRDAYAIGADVNVGSGFRLGGLYKHDLLGTLELERAQLIMRYGFGSSDKVIGFGMGLFVDPGITIVSDGEFEFGFDVGAETTLSANLHDRFSLGLFYRFDYGVWFPDGGVADESLGTWEVEPGLFITVGI